jgi:transposase InsO family protein
LGHDRLKNEFFYYRARSNVATSRFIDKLDRYIHYYLEERKKESLGWLSPMDYRKSLGLMA